MCCAIIRALKKKKKQWWRLQIRHDRHHQRNSVTIRFFGVPSVTTKEHRQCSSRELRETLPSFFFLFFFFYYLHLDSWDQIIKSANDFCQLLISISLRMGFPGGSNGKESACKAGNPGLIPGLGRSPGEGNGYPLQHSCLENSTYRSAWWARVQGVTKGWTWLSD